MAYLNSLWNFSAADTINYNCHSWTASAAATGVISSKTNQNLNVFPRIYLYQWVNDYHAEWQSSDLTNKMTEIIDPSCIICTWLHHKYSLCCQFDVYGNDGQGHYKIHYNKQSFQLINDWQFYEERYTFWSIFS